MQLMANKMAEKDTKEEIMKVCHYNIGTRTSIFSTPYVCSHLNQISDNAFIMIPDLCSLGRMTMGVTDVKKRRVLFICSDSKKEKGILLLIAKQLH